MPSSAIKQRLQKDGDTAEAALSCVKLTQTTPAACFRGLALASHFQPIYSLVHQRAVGYEGLVRCTDGNHAPLPPLEAFARCRGENDVVAMDRLCRALHLRNFAARVPGEDAWLFLNVHPRVIRKSGSHDAFFGQLLDELGFPARRVVVVISGAAGSDERHLKSWVDHYRGLGCLIALNDFGSGHSNFDRIWRLRPDIVKLDRSLIAEAAANSSARAMLPRIVSMLHETGALVFLQGIESGREALIAMDTDADFVQGHYFARPGPALAAPCQQTDAFARLYAQFRDLAAKRQARQRNDLHRYQQDLSRAADQLRMGLSLKEACTEFLTLCGVRRCLLLDAEGGQIGADILSAQEQSRRDPRYAPLQDATGANWLRQHYFRRALSEHGKVHVSRAYLSITDASRRITLSIAVPVDGRLCVLCADLTTDEPIREGAEQPAAAQEFRNPAEEPLLPACREHAEAIARAQIEMMARVRAEQQAIARKRASALAADSAALSPAFGDLEPSPVIAQRPASTVTRRPWPLPHFPQYLKWRHVEHSPRPDVTRDRDADRAAPDADQPHRRIGRIVDVQEAVG